MYHEAQNPRKIDAGRVKTIKKVTPVDHAAHVGGFLYPRLGE